MPESQDSDQALFQKALEQLLNLLADPKIMFASSTGTATPSAGSAEPSGAAELEQALSGAKPLLARTADGSWRWLTDFWDSDLLPSGEPATPAESTGGAPGQVVELKVAAAMPPFVPAPQPPSPTPAEIRREIGAVRDLDKAISDWTDVYLDLDKLAVEIRLLDLSPAYVSFIVSASNYLANAGNGDVEVTYPSLSTDRDLITSYYGLIDRSMTSIKLAFFLSELMARQFVGGRNPERIYRSMKVLSQELEFEAKAAAEVRETLISFQDDFPLMIGADSSSEEQTGQDFKKLAAENDWINDFWLDRVFTSVLDRDWPPRLDDNEIPEYFKDRFAALVRSIRVGSPMWRPRLHGLFLRVTDRVPQFRGWPANTRLAGFARLLNESSRWGEREFLLALLCELGFGEAVERIIVKHVKELDAARAPDLLTAARLRRTSGSRVLLVLRDPQEEQVAVGDEVIVKRKASACEDWLKSQQHAVCPIYAQDQWLGQQRMLTDTLRFTLLLLDGFSDEFLQRNSGFEKVAWCRLMMTEKDFEDAKAPLLARLREATPEILGVAGLDDAVAQARSLLRPSPPA